MSLTFCDACWMWAQGSRLDWISSRRSWMSLSLSEVEEDEVTDTLEDTVDSGASGVASAFLVVTGLEVGGTALDSCLGFLGARTRGICWIRLRGSLFFVS